MSAKPTIGSPLVTAGQSQAAVALDAGACHCGAITIGIDGQLYCHDLTPGLLDVLLELCPGSPELLARRATLEQESSHA